MSERSDAAAVLQLVTDVAEVGTWDWNRDTDEIWWNTWHAWLLGYEHEDGPRTYDEFRVRVHPDDLEVLERDIERAVATGGLYQNHFRVVLPDGTIRHLRGQGRVLADQPNRMVGVLVDTTPAVDAADRERDLLRGIREADRRARLSFAADIHDGPLQRLFAANLSAAGAMRALTATESTDPHVITRLQRCVDAIDDAQTGLRALLADMHEEHDGTHVDVFEYLHHLAHEVFDGRGERIHVIRSVPVTIDAPLLPELVHIAREALHNITKHAHAQNVTIQVTSTDTDAVIEITDDGVGFDQGAPPARAGHYGVRTMAHRAEVIGGSLTTMSRPGIGTTIVLMIPLS